MSRMIGGEALLAAMLRAELTRHQVQIVVSTDNV